MIHDNLQNIHQHASICPSVNDAINFLKSTDLTTLKEGIHEIDSKRVFGIVERYQPKQLADAVWETHKRYIDIQVIIAGSERMGCIPLTNDLKIKTPYNQEKDFTFYHTDGPLFIVNQGQFTIYHPNDVHAPGLQLDPQGPPVHKIVMKCLID